MKEFDPQEELLRILGKPVPDKRLVVGKDAFGVPLRVGDRVSFTCTQLMVDGHHISEYIICVIAAARETIWEPMMELIEPLAEQRFGALTRHLIFHSSGHR